MRTGRGSYRHSRHGRYSRLGWFLRDWNIEIDESSRTLEHYNITRGPTGNIAGCNIRIIRGAQKEWDWKRIIYMYVN